MALVVNPTHLCVCVFECVSVLIGELSSLTFSVMIERSEVIPVILLLCDVCLFPNTHLLIYLSSEIYLFPYFSGCIYLSRLCKDSF
jgi:hypothetical protein